MPTAAEISRMCNPLFAVGTAGVFGVWFLRISLPQAGMLAVTYRTAQPVGYTRPKRRSRPVYTLNAFCSCSPSKSGQNTSDE
jgi:hypothetical protein